MVLPGGVLILGAMRGTIHCRTGSAIIARDGEFQGELTANDILIEGRITSPVGSNGCVLPNSLSCIRAQGQLDEDSGEYMGGIIMLSSLAQVCSRLQARSYTVPRTANITGSILETISNPLF